MTCGIAPHDVATGNVMARYVAACDAPTRA